MDREAVAVARAESAEKVAIENKTLCTC
uniref:Uncharacterized protein n=1 Tax=Rhizophora mucronata TaxID=61149 RepID=A0A2P2JRL5_RHIMU